jgi:intein/homing endonuclease
MSEKISYQELIRQEYKKCLASPVYFMKKYVKIQHPIRGTINFNLYDFQSDTLQSFHDYKFNIILKSRQMGISTLVSAYSLWEMIFHKDKSILIISLKQEDAKDVITKVRFANENLPAWLKEKKLEDNRLSLKLENGSSIHGVATTKKSGVGKALSLLIIDEAALIDEADELWTSAQPTLSCLDKNELILTKNGFIRIDSLITKNTKIGFNSHDIIVDTMYGLQPSTDFYMSDKSDLYRVTFKSGGSILTTKEHPLMTLDGWKSVVDLKSNEDMVLSKYNQNLFGTEIDYTEFSPDIRKDSKKYKLSNKDIAYLCGLWIAEGHFIRGGIGITNIETSIVDWLINIGFKQYDDRHLIFHSTWMHELFKWIGCEGTSHTKKVPHRILSASKMEQIQFLRGLFDGDGCSLKEKGIKLTSVSHELVSNVRCMLLNFGIYSYIRPVTWKSTKSTVIKNKNSVFYGYELHIGGWDANNFYNNIGFSLERKQLNQKCLSKKSIKRIYPDKTAVKNLILESGLTIRNFSKKHKTFFDRYLWNGGNGLSISSVEKLLEVGDSSSKNYKLIHDQYIKDTTSYYDKVVSVIFEKNDFSYDIKVPNTECFIANGYINHNTGGNAIILSTPRGVGNWFHKMWVGAEESKDGTIGKNGFHAIKLPWFLHPDRDDEWRRIEGEKQGSAKKAAQEFDCDFLASGDNVIDLSIVTWYKKNRECDPAEIRGIDHGLWVWQYPDYSRSYIVSADVARGDGEDFSACHVIDAISLEQCAEYKGTLGTKDFGNFLVGLATEYNNAVLIIERENIGWATLQVAIDRNYPNLFYSSSELKYVDVQRQLRNKYDSDERKIVAGFSTNMKTRPLVISHLEQYCREEFKDGAGIKIYSKRTLAELDTFIWKNGKAQAMNSYNDDLVMSLGIGLWVRDTAIRLRQEGIDLTRSTMDHTSVAKSELMPFQSSLSSNLGQKSWQMQTGKHHNNQGGTEDIRWLLG